MKDFTHVVHAKVSSGCNDRRHYIRVRPTKDQQREATYTTPRVGTVQCMSNFIVTSTIMKRLTIHDHPWSPPILGRGLMSDARVRSKFKGRTHSSSQSQTRVALRKHRQQWLQRGRYPSSELGRRGDTRNKGRTLHPGKALPTTCQREEMAWHSTLLTSAVPRNTRAL